MNETDPQPGSSTLRIADLLLDEVFTADEAGVRALVALDPDRLTELLRDVVNLVTDRIADASPPEPLSDAWLDRVEHRLRFFDERSANGLLYRIDAVHRGTRTRLMTRRFQLADLQYLEPGHLERLAQATGAFDFLLAFDGIDGELRAVALSAISRRMAIITTEDIAVRIAPGERDLASLQARDRVRDRFIALIETEEIYSPYVWHLVDETNEPRVTIDGRSCSIDDLAAFDAAFLRAVLELVNDKTLAAALIGAKPATRRRIEDCLSVSARTGLRSTWRLRYDGPVEREEIVAARGAVLDAATRVRVSRPSG
jgi:hypothetical protein